MILHRSHRQGFHPIGKDPADQPARLAIGHPACVKAAPRKRLHNGAMSSPTRSFPGPGHPQDPSRQGPPGPSAGRGAENRSQEAAHLLVVDDEPNIRDILAASLRFAGFDTETAATGRQALRAVEAAEPDLIVLDVMLPDMDGFTVTRTLRERGVAVPVLFLTAKGETSDKIAGLTVGGDDYVTKPFSLEEVVARIRAVLRRTGRGPQADDDEAILRYADLELDEDAHEVHRAGRPIDLSPTEFKLLRYLMVNAGRVLSKAQIIDHVWEYGWVGDTNIVESYVSYLRRKVHIADDDGNPLPHLIHTRRGVGYQLRLPRGDGR